MKTFNSNKNITETRKKCLYDNRACNRIQHFHMQGSWESKVTHILIKNQENFHINGQQNCTIRIALVFSSVNHSDVGTFFLFFKQKSVDEGAHCIMCPWTKLSLIILFRCKF